MTKQNLSGESPCACCSGLRFDKCCTPLIAGKAAETPEQLMRSRYCGFYTGAVSYLIDTLHASQRKSDDAKVIQDTVDSVEWLGLRVLKSTVHGDSGVVEFVAFFSEDGVGQLHEKSRFVRENERWFYVDGDQLPAIKLSRNDDCICGSKKKYKRCHGGV